MKHLIPPDAPKPKRWIKTRFGDWPICEVELPKNVILVLGDVTSKEPNKWVALVKN